MPKRFIDLRVLALIIVIVALVGAVEYYLPRSLPQKQAGTYLPFPGGTIASSTGAQATAGGSSGIFVTPHGTPILVPPAATLQIH